MWWPLAIRLRINCSGAVERPLCKTCTLDFFGHLVRRTFCVKLKRASAMLGNGTSELDPGNTSHPEACGH